MDKNQGGWIMPGFGALVALLGLGAVAFIVVRRKPGSLLDILSQKLRKKDKKS